MNTTHMDRLIGDEETTVFFLKHSHTSLTPQVTVVRVSNGRIVEPDVYIEDEHTVRLEFGDPPTKNQFRVGIRP